MLCVNSPNEFAQSKAAQERLWQEFLRGGTNHSGLACTLPYIIRRCEREKQPYILKAVPSAGYWIEPYKL